MNADKKLVLIGADHRKSAPLNFLTPSIAMGLREGNERSPLMTFKACIFMNILGSSPIRKYKCFIYLRLIGIAGV
jgi:hypothetical protein